ncbi:MAG: hypothetical protein GY796_15215 [Chloroflexi bacterium]|nr:hypothetical protein [Chloroflexota bacterium]
MTVIVAMPAMARAYANVLPAVRACSKFSCFLAFSITAGEYLFMGIPNYLWLDSTGNILPNSVIRKSSYVIFKERAKIMLGMGILLNPELVIPAKAGIHLFSRVDSRLRGNDKLKFMGLFNPHS